MISISLFLAVAAWLLPMALAQAVQENDPQKQCNETDHVQVEIHLNNTVEAMMLHCNRDVYGDCNNHDAHYSLYSKVYDAGVQNQNHSLEAIVPYGEFFSGYDDVENGIRKVSHCVPRGQCIVATTQKVPPSQISIYHGGEPIELGPTFATRLQYSDVRHVTTTEMGPCKPECGKDKDEVLWEMDMYLDWANDPSWVLESLDDGQIMADCRSKGICAADTSFAGPIRTFRQCLPANQCLRVVAELPEYPRKQTLPMFFAETTLNITVQGKQEATLSRYSYAAHEFNTGSDCPIETKKCKPDQSLFEMFLRRGYDENENPTGALFWNVTQYNKHEDKYHSFLAGEFGTVGGIHYAQGCLPKNQCFNVTIDPKFYDGLRPVQGWYRLVLDNIIYYDNMYNRNPLEGFKDITRIGDCTSMDCPGQDNTLFDMTVSTSMDKPGELSVNEWFIEIAKETPEVENYSEKWEQLLEDLRDGEIFINAPPGTTYRRYVCVPNDLCTEFETDLNTTYFNYTVILDGKERPLKECESSYGGCVWKSKPWGNSCPETDKLSKGAVAAVVLGCIAFLCVAGMTLFLYYHRQGREVPNKKNTPEIYKS